MTPNGIMEHIDDIERIKLLPEGEWRAILFTEIRGIRGVAREEALKVNEECFKRNCAITATVATIISVAIGIIAMVI